jgi:NifU-like protein involved in Fe-S cluster formation
MGLAANRKRGQEPLRGLERKGESPERLHGVIQDVKFKCMGCAVAIACSSMATEMVLGKPVDEAYRITEEAVAKALGGIPEYKMRCSNLAPAAIRKAIDDWRRLSDKASKIDLR